MEKNLKLAFVSLGVACGVLGLKFWAYWITNSLAFYSDALESTVNIVAALCAIGAVYVSSKPADARHPYGHHKVEYFSAVFEGVFIVLSALIIFKECYDRFLNPPPFAFSWQALALNGVACLLNGVWAWVLLSYGKKHRSPALSADGKHLLSDVISSVGVLFGVLIVYFGGWKAIDSLLACVVALNILWSGWGLVRESVGGLMDAAAPPEELEKIRQIIAHNSEGALEAHDLRTRHAGKVTFVEFHLVVPGQSTVLRAHEICDQIEKALKESLGHPIITIHVEPEDKAKHSGIVVL